ncbi:uncharacterized protein LOC111717071 [Eurytemora carolleeae]|uniref:uncharacterized protein LOC111717071 n=1 Tax=Eurytemora carolleeae TaxID=1294199 RepID=UPI000C77BC7F|nr:uncharacterized protein LOC111717071 [Eurytemora carolleeae]|eukprot:XP_023348356.1 uncharacterized protein LOC111717071 [Eurytemora affinis]
MVRCTKALIKSRSSYLPDGNPYLFGIGGTGRNNSRLSNSLVVKNSHEKAGVPPTTAATRRKLLATVYQMRKPSDAQMDTMSNHLGHSLTTHKEYYKMQTSLVEMQMVAPVLYDLDRGEIELGFEHAFQPHTCSLRYFSSPVEDDEVVTPRNKTIRRLPGSQARGGRGGSGSTEEVRGKQSGLRPPGGRSSVEGRGEQSTSFGCKKGKPTPGKGKRTKVFRLNDDEKADIARYFSRNIQMGETINKQQAVEFNRTTGRDIPYNYVTNQGIRIINIVSSLNLNFSNLRVLSIVIFGNSFDHEKLLIYTGPEFSRTEKKINFLTRFAPHL